MGARRQGRHVAGDPCGAAGGAATELPRIVAASEFTASALIRDPEALGWVARHLEPSIAGAANSAATGASPRRQRRPRRSRCCANGGAAKCCASRGATSPGTSDVTDDAGAAVGPRRGCIRAAVTAAQRHLEPTFGRPRNAPAREVPLIVVAMGKLGGRELNFSSDIDLVFLYAEAGETEGARPVDNAEYFNRLGREVIRLLDARTEEGFVFRVDMRLRPFGDSGALVVSLAALEDYLQEHGRDWERYAWIKARADRRGGTPTRRQCEPSCGRSSTGATSISAFSIRFAT